MILGSQKKIIISSIPSNAKLHFNREEDDIRSYLQCFSTLRSRDGIWMILYIPSAWRHTSEFLFLSFSCISLCHWPLFSLSVGHFAASYSKNLQSPVLGTEYRPQIVKASCFQYSTKNHNHLSFFGIRKVNATYSICTGSVTFMPCLLSNFTFFHFLDLGSALYSWHWVC